MKTEKIKSCGWLALSLTVGVAFFAQAKEVDLPWFQENYETVGEALDNGGVTDYGQWATLEALSVAGQSVCIDADAEEPVTYTLNTAHRADEKICFNGNLIFTKAYEWSALQADTPVGKAGICLAKSGENTYFAVVVTNSTEGKMEWQLTSATVAEVGVGQNIQISTSGTTLTYKYEDSNGDYATLATTTIAADAEISTAKFIGKGSFDLISGTYAMDAKAQIGETYYATADEAVSNVTADCTVKLLDSGIVWKPNAKRISYSFSSAEGFYQPASIDTSILNASGLKYTLQEGAFTATVDLTGDGASAETAFEIGSLADLNKFNNGVTANIFTEDEYFKQTADLDLTGFVWGGIGGDEAKFLGHYLGQGHKISNMKFKDGTYRGFFSTISTGEVSNLTVECAGFETGLADSIASTNRICGGVLAGMLHENAKLIGCTAEGAIWGTHNAAGLVAFARGGAEIISCTNKAEVTGNYTKVSGFIAYNQSGTLPTIVSNCVNLGAISATGDVCVLNTSVKPGCDGVSAFVGWNGMDLKIVGCENRGTLTGVSGSSVGSLVGKIGTAADKVSLGGCVAKSSVKPIGSGFVGSVAYAAVDGEAGTATYCYPNGADDFVVGGKYWVMLAVGNTNEVFVLTKAGDSISFNTQVGSFATTPVGVGDGLVLATSGEAPDITYTANNQGPYTPGEGGGSVTPVPGEDKVYEVAPDASSGTVTVQGISEGDTIRVSITNDMTIIGVPANQIQIKLNGSVIDNKYFVGGNAEGFSTALNPTTAKAALIEETATEKPLVVGDDVAVKINSVAGLYYTLVRGDEPGAQNTPIQSKLGDGKSLTLEDGNKPTGKAFYVIETTKAAQVVK